MTETIGIRELRDTLTHTIRRVRAGETIEVTHDGVPVAVLSPYVTAKIDRLIADGRATPGRPFRPPRRMHEVTGPMSASEAIEDGRRDRS